jgi:BirA family biotin operon repressor/biotin-[acetyl-CoA-carboxylase] ligase
VAGSGDWRVRKGSSVPTFSDRLVVQGGGAGLLDLSVCLSADGREESGRLGLLRPLVAASTSEGIRRDTGVVSWLHWPDLVTIGDRVVATTSLSPAPRSESNEKTGAVARISVNCFAPRPSEFSAVSMPSTSIRKVLGVEIDVDLLRDKVLHALNWYHAEWQRGMSQKLIERMRPTIACLGREVEVSLAGGRVMKGRASGLDDEGSLMLEQKRARARTTSLRLRSESVNLVRVVR